MSQLSDFEALHEAAKTFPSDDRQARMHGISLVARLMQHKPDLMDAAFYEAIRAETHSVGANASSIPALIGYLAAFEADARAKLADYDGYRSQVRDWRQKIPRTLSAIAREMKAHYALKRPPFFSVFKPVG